MASSIQRRKELNRCSVSDWVQFIGTGDLLALKALLAIASLGQAEPGGISHITWIRFWERDQSRRTH
ncbi:MAG: hypothetical protein ACOYN0_15060 [Phycisphaerales bacterium]